MFTLATDCVDMRPHKYLGIWSLRFVFLFSFFSACEHGQEVRISICTTSELNVEYGNNVLGIIFFSHILWLLLLLWSSPRSFHHARSSVQYNANGEGEKLHLCQACGERERRCHVETFHPVPMEE